MNKYIFNKEIMNDIYIYISLLLLLFNYYFNFFSETNNFNGGDKITLLFEETEYNIICLI